MSTIAILIPTLKKGGAEKQAVLLGNALADTHKVHLFVLFPEAGLEKELMDLYAPGPENITMFSGSSMSRLRELYRRLRAIKADTMFCYLTYPDFWGPIVGRMAGVKHIYQGLRNASLPTAKLMLEKIGNVLATGAVVNNYAGMDVFGRKGIRRMTVIPNCYLNPKAAVERPMRETVRVVSVARFVAQKDYETAIAAFARAHAAVPSLRYLIIGHGELEQQIREWIKAYGVEDCVEMIINPKNIPSFLADSDIYLSTSLFEGTSNSIMEAMDASLPVVATDVGDNARLVDNEKSGFVVPAKDVDAISSAIVRLAESHDLRVRMGREGNCILHREYSMQAFRQNYLKLLS